MTKEVELTLCIRGLDGKKLDAEGVKNEVFQVLWDHFKLNFKTDLEIKIVRSHDA